MTVPVRQPSRATLRKYGLSLDRWQDMLISQDGVCAICRRVPASGILCVDHFHARGFKRMSAKDKAKYTRGLCCSYCNRYRVGKLDLHYAAAVLSYLEKHRYRTEATR